MRLTATGHLFPARWQPLQFVTLAQIDQVSEGVREKAETFEEREELLRERFTDTAD